MRVLKNALVVKKVLFAALIFFSVLQLKAQDSMNLQQCINYALEHNTQLLRTELDVEQRENNYTRTKASVLPTVNGYASHNYNFGRTIDPFTNQFANQQSRNNSFSLSSGMVLFNGLSQLNNIRQAKWAQDAGHYSLQKMKDDVGLNVANQYLQILLLTERINQLQAQVQTSTERLARTQSMFKAGALAQTKLLEAEAQKANDELLLVEIENQLVRAYLVLKQYMNYDVTRPLKIQQVNFSSQLQNYSETDLQNTLKNRIPNLPSVKSANSSRESALYNLKAMQGNASPSLAVNASVHTIYSSLAQNYQPTVSGYDLIGVTGDSVPVYGPRLSYNTSKIGFSQQLENNFGQSIGFTLNIPIFNGLQTKYSIQNARINLKSAQLGLTDAEQQARNDIYTAYEGMRLAQKKFQAANTKLKAQEALYKQSETSFNLGAMSFYDWSAVQNNYSIAQSESLQAKYELIFQTKVFEYYLGKPVQF